MPQSVEIYGVKAHCEPYVFPLRICYKCWRFGHSQKFCKASSVKCCKCGLEHEEKECKATNLKCINCGEAHKASDKNCPERDRQDKIRIEMAYNKTSFFEAQQKFPRKQKSVQSRLGSNRDFPSLPQTEFADNTTGRNNAWDFSKSHTSATRLGAVPKERRQPMTHRNEFPQPDIYEEEPHVFRPNPHATTEIERMTNQIKKELIAQFNLTGIFQKIQAIQNIIQKNTNKTETIEQDLFLINISSQLDSIVNPEVFYEARSETHSNTNSNNEPE